MPVSPVPNTRASLIIRLADPADAEAWNEFFEIYGPTVYRLCRKRGLQPADADDLVQDVFSAVSSHIDDWLARSQRGSFRAWLFSIARNTTINLLRTKRRRRETDGADWEGKNGPPAETENPIGEQIEHEYRREVFRHACERVRATVAETTWQAFWHTAVEEQPPSATAERLGISVGSVYIARSRVMSRLQTIVQQHEHENHDQ